VDNAKQRRAAVVRDIPIDGSVRHFLELQGRAAAVRLRGPAGLNPLDWPE